MGMTIAQKILAAHCGRDEVSPHEVVMAEVDVALGNDITAPLAIETFEKSGAEDVFDREKIVLVLDHFTPNKDIKSAEQCRRVREFAREQKIKHFFDVGEMGIEHVLLPELGLVLPGDLIIGADSHTCTYGALGAFATGVGSTDLAAAMISGKGWFKVPETVRFVLEGRLEPWVSGKDLILRIIGNIGVSGAHYEMMEFTGPTIKKLSMASRLTMSNMAIEAGAKGGIFAFDEVTKEYLKGRARREYTAYQSDPDAPYRRSVELDVSGMEPQVACPNLPSNVRSVRELKDTRLDQVVIGSCTNGRLEDLETAAGIVRGRKVASGVRLIVIPGSQRVYLDALKKGFVADFIEAGAAVSTPTCGPCLGGHMGILARNEVALATTNRNFTGRMGHPESEVYLSNPAVAAASALTGRIIHPDEI